MRADYPSAGLALVLAPRDLPRHKLDVVIEIKKIVPQSFPELYAFDCVQPPYIYWSSAKAADCWNLTVGFVAPHDISKSHRRMHYQIAIFGKFVGLFKCPL